MIFWEIDFNLCFNSEYEIGVDGIFSTEEIVIESGLNSLASKSFIN
jgi:hypothetical protein